MSDEEEWEIVVEDSEEEPKKKVEEETPTEDEEEETRKKETRSRRLLRQRNEARLEVDRLKSEVGGLKQRLDEYVANQETASSNAQSDSELQRLEVDLEDAYEQGDHRRAAKTAKEIARIEAQRELRAQLQKEVEKRPKKEEEEPQFPSYVADAVRDWRRSNMWYGQDEERTEEARRIAGEIEREINVVEDPDGFFDELDSRLKVKKKAPEPPASHAETPKGKKKMRLTKEELKMAEAFDMTPEEYATEKYKREQMDA